MKLSCNVTRDLLPLYHDGVCSEESGALVEEHIAECGDCRALLNELRLEIEVPKEEPNDLALIGKISRSFEQLSNRAWLRGAAAVLAVVLTIFAGVNVWWFTGPRAFYQKFLTDDAPMWTLGYTMVDDIYEYKVQMPTYLRDDGNVQVMMDFKRTTRSIELGRDVQTHLTIDRNMIYTVELIVIDHTKVSGQAHAEVMTTEECIILDENLDPIYAANLTEEEIAHQDQILEDFRWEIMSIIQAARSQWPFLAE